jgi:Txe/YoeB family toxin of Txe-Axe toxin-antitoxin module
MYISFFRAYTVLDLNNYDPYGGSQQTSKWKNKFHSFSRKLTKLCRLIYVEDAKLLMKKVLHCNQRWAPTVRLIH